MSKAGIALIGRGSRGRFTVQSAESDPGPDSESDPESDPESESEFRGRKVAVGLRGSVSFRLGGHARCGARPAPTPGKSCEDLVALSGGVVTGPAPGLGMTTETKRPGAHRFIAFELALQIIRNLRGVVPRVRTRDGKLAQQIVGASSSIASNVAEGNRRIGKDRLHFFRVAAGSADETRAHLHVALAWGWVDIQEIDRALDLLDQELAILYRLTH